MPGNGHALQNPGRAPHYEQEFARSVALGKFEPLANRVISTLDYAGLPGVTPAVEPYKQEPVSDDMATEADVRRSEIAAAEARTDTKITRMEGKLDLVLSKVEAIGTAVVESRRAVLESRRAVIANGWVIFGTIVALIVGLAVIFPAIFDLGMKLDEKIGRSVDRHMSGPQ